MSRKLYVSTDISIDEAIAEIADDDPLSALLWPWLLVHLDDWGRSSASARRLKGAVAPMFEAVTVEVIERALQAYAAKGLIALYEVGGHRYLAVEPEKWWRYQTHIHRSKREVDGSAIPAPPADAFTTPAEVRGESRNVAGICASLPPSLPPSPTPSPTPSARDERKHAKTIEKDPTSAQYWTAKYLEALEAEGRPRPSRSQLDIFGAKVKEIQNLDPDLMVYTIARMIERGKGPPLLALIYEDCRREGEEEIWRMQTEGARRVR